MLGAHEQSESDRGHELYVHHPEEQAVGSEKCNSQAWSTVIWMRLRTVELEEHNPEGIAHQQPL